MTSTCTVGEYLLLRLKEIGIKHIFGVPGDYNLGFLDQIEAFEGLEWIGNCNELNAAYAADGYARLNGIGAVVTTFGVGELSAINGIAGSYAEQVPVIKITGAPATSVSEKGAYVHHTLGDGNFTHFAAMFKEVTVAQTNLTQQNAAEEIDRVLTECLLHKRPVYIQLAADISYKEIEVPHAPLVKPAFTSKPEQLESFVRLTADEINQSKAPILVADYEVIRYGMKDLLLRFVEQTGLPIASLSMGKGVIDENHPQFIGVYNGKLSDEYMKDKIANSDCTILIGVKLTDSITGGFSFLRDLDKINMIEIHPSSSRIHKQDYQAAMEDVLQGLVQHVKPRSREELSIQSLYEREVTGKPIFNPSSGAITQKRFWERIGQFLEKGDVLLAEQGTSFFGVSTVPLQAHTTFVGQPLWGSIGYTLPAVLGTCLASPERRHILIIGDGSFQLTVQELSTLMKLKQKPVIILINNDGYTVERAIHGAEQAYNDIHMWQYHRLPEVFGIQNNCVSIRIQNEKELDDALKQAKNPDRLMFLEVLMDSMDAPELLVNLGKMFAAQNNY